jgi:hypothetical protein
MNRAIDTLPDLTQHWLRFQPKLRELEKLRDEQLAVERMRVRVWV